MTTRKEGMRDIQHLLKNFNSCKPIMHRNSSIIEPPSAEKLSLLVLKPKEHPSPKMPHLMNSENKKDFFQLSSHKYQNYKYMKFKYSPTFYKEIFAASHFKQHSMVPQEKRIESIYNQRKNELSSDKRYKFEKSSRVLNSRYKESRNPMPNGKPIKKSERTLQLIDELKQSIEKLNESRTQKLNLWISPYLARSGPVNQNEAHSLPSKASRRVNGLEECLNLFHELQKQDFNKSIRLKIMSSGSKRGLALNEGNRSAIGVSNGFLREDSKGSLLRSRAFEDESIGIQTLKEHFNDVFNSQWERIFFALGLSPEDVRMGFDKFLLFYRILLIKSASFQENYAFLKKTFSFPLENMEELKNEEIEGILKGFFKEQTEENKKIVQIIGKNVVEVLANRNKSNETIKEIFDLIFLRKKNRIMSQRV